MGRKENSSLYAACNYLLDRDQFPAGLLSMTRPPTTRFVFGSEMREAIQEV